MTWQNICAKLVGADGEDQPHCAELGVVRILAPAVPGHLSNLAKLSPPITNPELEIIHWCTSYPLISTRHLELFLEIDPWELDQTLHDLVGHGCLQRIPFRYPYLPRDLVVWLPTDQGLAALARKEDLAPKQSARRRGLTPGRIYRIVNSLPWFYEIRHFAAQLHEVGRGFGLRVAFYAEETVFRSKRPDRTGRFRADAFLILRKNEVAYPLILFLDDGSFPVEDYLPRIEALGTLREARDSPLPGSYAAFPSVVYLTTTYSRLLLWQKLARRGSLRVRAGPMMEYFATLEDLRPREPDSRWRYFEPVWYDIFRRRLRLLDISRPLPWEEYEKFVHARRDWVPRPDKGRVVLGEPFRERALNLSRLSGRPAARPLALANLALGRREKQVLLWMADHPLLREDILAESLRLKPKTIDKYLRRLTRIGFLNRVHPRGSGKRFYLLSAWGKAWLMKLRRDPHPFIRIRWWEWDVRRFLLTLDHTLAIQEVLFEFHRLRGDGSHVPRGLHTWDSEIFRRQIYTWWGRIRFFDPDAYGLYRYGNLVYPFYLEVDRGRVTRKFIARKAQAYYTWRRSEGFTLHNPQFPSVLVVTQARRGSEGNRRARNILSTFARVGDEMVEGRLPIFVTTFDQLRKHGPLGQIWLTHGREDPVGWPIFDPKEASDHPGGKEPENQG